MDKRKKTGIILFSISGGLLLAYFLISLLRVDTVHPLFRVGILILVCILCYIGVRIYEKTLGRSYVRVVRKRAFILFFALYLLLTFNFTWADEFYKRERDTDKLVFELSEEERQEYFKTSLQTKPFKTVQKYVNGYRDGRVKTETLLRNLAGNVILLMPLAFFLPLLFDKQRNFLLFLITAALVSALIEAVQLVLMIGVCDVDDLILNTAGAVIAYLLLSLPPMRRLVKLIAFE